MSDFAHFSAEEGALFLVRWRGRQEGPFTASTVAAKLAAREIGLLHEVYYTGRWMTVRDYIAERQVLAAALPTQDNQERQERASLRLRVPTKEPEREPGRPVRAPGLQMGVPVKEPEREPPPEPAMPPPLEPAVEDEEKDELWATKLLQPIRPMEPEVTMQILLQPHRGRQIFLLAVAGLFICGPVCLPAVIMGAGDLHQMDAGIMDPGGRSQTSLGRNIGILGIIVWLAGAVFCFFSLRH